MNGQNDRGPSERPPIELIRGASLFLDFDGTLVEISRTPDAVVVEDRLRTLLGTLQNRLDGRVVILTGRGAAHMAELMSPVQIVVGGSHGLEIMGGEFEHRPTRPSSLDLVARELVALETDFPGVLVESKPLGIALHYRLAPDAESVCLGVAAALADRTGLHLQRGKMVIELRPGDGDKGSALRRLMTADGFSGTRPIFIGDDLTDEPAFLAAAHLGGAGILVGDRRDSAASFRLASVGDTMHWLNRAAEFLE